MTDAGKRCKDDLHHASWRNDSEGNEGNVGIFAHHDHDGKKVA